MVKRRRRGRKDTRGINKEDDGEELGREKDGDSEEDNDEEVVKHVLKRRFEGRG